ncbi:MAG TPA: ribonuclease HI family protein [Acidobacteriaceae bacterium]|nr:ribonuclease HI family protein [Acidobacteriaceae bacterium]
MSFPSNSGDRENGLFSPEASGEASGWAIAYCDGGSRGNPGPAGFGVYIQDEEGRVLGELSEYLGKRTNNFAEYSALLAALQFAIAQGRRRLRVIADSELMVKQMKGQYRVNSPDLRPLYEQARRLTMQLDRFEIRHVLREKNRHADRLANLAMDRGMKGAAPGSRIQAEQQTKTTPETATRPAAAQPTMLRGFTRNGVVHLLGSELPDGIFVKVIPE